MKFIIKPQSRNQRENFRPGHTCPLAEQVGGIAMGQIVGSGFNATAAMFALWLGVMGVIAVYPSCCEFRAAANRNFNQDGTVTITVLPS